MMDAVDRLPAWAFTETELDQMAKLVINPNRYDKTPKHIIWYHLYRDGQYTGKAVLLAVESVVEGWSALNRIVEPLGLEAQIGWYGDALTDGQTRVNMLYILLERWNYIGQLEFTGDDKVFDYKEWMAELC